MKTEFFFLEKDCFYLNGSLAGLLYGFGLCRLSGSRFFDMRTKSSFKSR